MDTASTIALIASGLSVPGAFFAIWQAASASKQAQHAEEQSNAAIRQAQAAEEQVRLADEQLKQMRAEARSQLHDDMVSAFSALHIAFKNFVYIGGLLDRQLRTGAGSAELSATIKDLQDNDPRQHAALFSLAKLPANSLVGSVLIEASDRATLVWGVVKRIVPAMFGTDDDVRARTVAELDPTLTRLVGAVNHFADVTAAELLQREM